MGTRSHKPSFVVLDIGQSGGMNLFQWFYAHKEITFQEDILRHTVRFPRMSVYQRVRQCNTPTYGFSTTVEHLREVQQMANPNQFLQDLIRGGCRIIHLTRRDMLRHAIATLRAYSVNFRFDYDKPVEKSGTFVIDVSELIDCLKYLDNQRLEANAILHAVPHLDLVYEDDLMDPNSYQATAEKLSAFLDVASIEPVGNSLKLVHQQLEDIVSNYDELREGLEASDYAYLLTENKHLMTML